METTNFSSLSDRDLLLATRLATDAERCTTAALISLLAEVDARRLYLAEGYSSMFTFCTGALRLSEPAAYSRITAARIARQLPLVLSRLKEGAVSLTTISLLAPHLTEDNCEVLLEATRNQGKRDVERLVAGFQCQPDIRSSIRALPVRSVPIAPITERLPEDMLAFPTETAAAAIEPTRQPTTQRRPDVIAPITAKRYLIRITVDAETHAKLERLRALLRHQIPDGDPAAIVDLALSALIAKAEHTKFAATKRSTRSHSERERLNQHRSTSRHVPATIRRAVWARDGGRCAFVGTDGRCRETGFLEFHHVVPFASGGPSTAENLQLRCRAHNAHEAAKEFGEWVTIAKRPARS